MPLSYDLAGTLAVRLGGCLEGMGQRTSKFAEKNNIKS